MYAHVDSRIVLLYPVGITKMAEKVFPPQVKEERIFIEEALLTKFAERVAAVRSVVGVTLPPMQSQVGPVVQSPLVREDLNGTGIVNALCLKLAQECRRNEGHSLHKP